MYSKAFIKKKIYRQTEDLFCVVIKTQRLTLRFNYKVSISGMFHLY